MPQAWSLDGTHHFIRFELNLGRCSPNFWMLLGESRSKCDHIRFVPLESTTAFELSRVYLAKGIAATTAIEGNTLSEAQVRERMDQQLELPLSQEYMGREIDNMVAAYNEIVTRATTGEHVPLTIETLEHLNRQILDGTNLASEVTPGLLREHNVAAGGYLAPPAAEVPALLGRLCEWLEGPSFMPPTPSDVVPYAFIKAVTAHVYLEWVHPFGDGNGRLGRLAEFLILISCGVPVPAAHILTSHYNETRPEYYRQLQQASKNGGDLRPFLAYAAQGWVDGLFAAIKRLHRQQEQLMWVALVDEQFDEIGRHGEVAHRRRLVAQVLGKTGAPVTRSEIRTLSPEIADAYAGKTSKTISRDLNYLIDLGFLEVHDGIYRAQIARVRGMRPFALPTSADRRQVDEAQV